MFFCKETYHWSLRKVGLSLEGFGGEFEVGKIAFELEDLKKEKGKRKKRRKEIGEFSFLGTDLGLWGVIYICKKRNSERGFFSENFSGRRTEGAEKNDCSQDHPGMF